MTPVIDLRQLVAAARGQIRIFGAGLVATGILVPLLTVALAAASGLDPLRLFSQPRNPLAWMSSAQLVLAALIAYLNHQTARGKVHAPGRRIWLFVAMGFAFLALDERFELHEALRRAVFEPAGLFSGTWIETGDIGLHLYLLAGLVASWFLRAPLARCPPALPIYAAAVGASAVLVVVSGLDQSIVRNWPAPPFWDSTFDAVGKIWAQDLFMIAFLVVLDRQIAEAARPGPVRPARPGSGARP